jgi:hypothetical protein
MKRYLNYSFAYAVAAMAGGVFIVNLQNGMDMQG